VTETGSFMDSLTERQREVLSAIAINQDGGHDPQILRALAERELIFGYREKLPGWPPVEVVRWEMPVWAHIEWARWCAEQPDEEAGDAT
jgi:hypothetical protein